MAIKIFNRKQLRKYIREKRRALSEEERRQASAGLCERIQDMAVYAKSRHIAGFLAFDGEMDILPLLHLAINSGKNAYLPIILGKNKAMAFAPYHPQEPLRRNYFGILEPDVDESRYLSPQALDLVLTPLVAFDENCNRLGVGGGFYDRTFAFLNSESGESAKNLTPPCLLGVAYDFQRVSEIQKESWDVPLSAVATDKSLYQR